MKKQHLREDIKKRLSAISDEDFKNWSRVICENLISLLPEINSKQIELATGSLGFTFCQTPVIYQIADKSSLQIHYSDGSMESDSGPGLDNEISQHIFRRDGVIEKIVVFVENP